jgi:hypothetical protein
LIILFSIPEVMDLAKRLRNSSERIVHSDQKMPEEVMQHVLPDPG